MADTNFTPQQIEEFLQEFFDVVGARQYIGARYVPIFGRAGEDTVEWDDGAPYEPLTVVMHEGVSYVSRRYVPRGIGIADTDYWVQTYRFNAQVEQYRQEVLSFQDQIDEIREDYVPFPDPLSYSKFGTLGQVLATLADGSTRWSDPVVPSDEQAEAVITDWLDAHPEATTTVQDGAITWAKIAESLKPNVLHIGVHVQPSNYYTLLPDADLQPNNTIYLINNQITSAMTQHLPVYGAAGILVKFAFSPTNPQGCAQVYTTTGGDTYARTAFGPGSTPTFSQWVRLNGVDDGYVTWAKLAESLQPYMVHIGRHVEPSNYETVLPDADLQPNNTIYLINHTITSTMVQNLPTYGQPGILVKFAFSPTNQQGCAQVFVCRPNDGTRQGAVYARVAYGAGATSTYNRWVRLTGQSESLTHGTAAIFRKVVACGDSYTSGWINNTHTNEDYAWPAYMAKITGQSWINCGSSGATVLSWQTAARGLTAAQAAGPAQAYVIGLMINDVITAVPLGTSADIGTQAQTYYGGLSQIVEALHTISPSAKIFIQTCPRTTDTFQPYNQAVRDVVSHYANTMNTHLLDLYAYLDLYNVPSITGDAQLGHYTAIGYEQFAQILEYIMSEYINTHISAFQDVYAIPTA